jgi:hypothetical protein
MDFKMRIQWLVDKLQEKCNASLKRGEDWLLPLVTRQGCFQSIIKRVIQILWATIVIPRISGLGGVLIRRGMR